MNKNYSKMDKGTKNFLNDTLELCLKHKVSIRMVADTKVKIHGRTYARGYFSDAPLELAIATISDSQFGWLEVLLHESCHLDQTINKRLDWYKDTSWALMEDWLDGTVLSKPKLERITVGVQNIEIDCEKRSLRKIKRYKLPIDQVKYVQRANAYAYYIRYLKKIRYWHNMKGSNEYDVNIWPHMPKKFLKSYLEIPKEIEELFKQNFK